MASIPTQVANPMMLMMANIQSVPDMEPVPERKICKYGYPVGVSKAASISPMQNNRASNIAKPNIPLMATVDMMDRGMRTTALWISSAI